MMLKKEVLEREMENQTNNLEIGYKFRKYQNIAFAEILGKDIALAVSNFKCQSLMCKGTSKNLQFHHLITRYCKTYMDFLRYSVARAFWGNIIVLCEDCHSSFHKGLSDIKMEEQVKQGRNIYITESRINSVKERFYTIEKEVNHGDTDIEGASKSPTVS